mgnify:CR=1 FL=1
MPTLAEAAWELRGNAARAAVALGFLAYEAVVTVEFFTPTGKTTKANLAEVAVPAGESKFIAVNDYILRQPVLGASVTARRGRIVAWRTMFARAG